VDGERRQPRRSDEQKVVGEQRRPPSQMIGDVITPMPAPCSVKRQHGIGHWQ
jgi:hypothetical protein